MCLIQCTHCLPPDIPKATAASEAPDTKSSPAAPTKFNITSLATVVHFPGVPALLLMQAGTNMAGALVQSTLALVLQQRFGLSSRDNGLVLSWVGACVVLGELRRGEDAPCWGQLQTVVGLTSLQSGQGSILLSCLF